MLADDHALVRAGIRALLEKLPDVEVVGEAGDGWEIRKSTPQNYYENNTI
jgi:DNA-binding NarL/FixJ family response regulator